MKQEELIEHIDRIHALVHDPEFGNYSQLMALGSAITSFIEGWNKQASKTESTNAEHTYLNPWEESA